jgi:hypothetical protein
MKIKKTVVFLLTLALTMKSQFIAIVAAVVLVGCGESQPTEPPTAQAPGIALIWPVCVPASDSAFKR